LYLKNITLRGFKSFGNRSTLDFEQGISVIVGPNGSGKSNVADGLSWVLGEQSPKSLRGSSMGDVIFRSKKQEMGIAEVSLLFDNSDRMMDVEFSDVKITRRVYSEGGSDYFINSSPCRLMDIQELIADAGIGKGLHVIINQGQVNEAAMLRPVDRKLIIDEVLGIAKHKARRKKSLSRLDRVRDDIMRLDDLLEEITRTMDPLEIEAKRAREYADIVNELKKEEVSLFLASLSELNLSWEKLEKEHSRIKKDIKGAADSILEAEKAKSDLINSIGSRQQDYEKLRARIESFEGSANRLQNGIVLIESKKNVFSTLMGMFDMELSNGTASGKSALEAARDDQKEIMDLSFLGKIIKKVEIIEGQFADLMGKVNDALKGQGLQKELEDEGKLLSAELKKILKELKEGNQARESGKLKKAAGKMKMKLEEEKKRVEARVKKVAELKRLCSENLERSERFREILYRQEKISQVLKKRLYPEFEKQKQLISKDRQKIEGSNTAISELKIRENSLENELYRVDLDKEQVKEKVKDITVSITDDYNMSIEYASRNFKPSEDTAKSDRSVRRLKGKIRKYGSVNPNAAIEFARIKKRFDFLNGQKKDLEESRIKLEELIKEINEKITTVFLEKFEDINTNFSKYFRVLFPGGNGELVLDKIEDGDSQDEDLGVDLKVDIGNNKTTTLSLLSGGEKTLVSLAFLFSVFSVKLSPFYIFDEADAALDDANIDRFQNLIKEFAGRQQIIIITHQKKTMEVADTIYGVTMQSDGISKVESEKMENA